jgi:hypothetical protein
MMYGMEVYLHAFVTSTVVEGEPLVKHNVWGAVTAVPLEAWSGPEGSKKLRFPDFMTTARDGGKFVSFTQRPHLPPGNTPGTHFC